MENAKRGKFITFEGCDGCGKSTLFKLLTGQHTPDEGAIRFGAKVDLAYFDPPYCNSHADYQSFYHLLETYVEYWKDKDFVNGTKRYEPKKYSGFDKNSEAISNLQLLFERADHIPTWLVSYNDRSFPDIETMVGLIEPYRKVKVERKKYSSGRGGKGSVAGSSEILLVCTMK